MKLPSKLISYNESIFPKALSIIELINNGTNKVIEVYIKSNMESTDFIDALCFLFAINKIQLNEDGVLKNVN
ncbi:TPA: ABC-three component system middle component 7 [Streptococcus pyogenes]|uniref:ABC-three component system middle component 7 n=1 Tax=Streptococcus pyogenes TaxID=1314 RepID=UPI0018E1619B|nr:ABC-three component system middle component 7 [Streptococcus pyogenes]HEN2436742.1 hypothetical protein [Streptococcus agalactiae]QQA64084.1 hypothetical protein JAN99_08155 [Streptococcus pyogenes]HEN2437726.1 hypothetical protein [Streptococcus agalactiae]HEN6009025.1 hypothetical protein [Streptococcus agalactiae]HEN6010313.1 hypothetical protein [Streptococcus agalactiae]